ncbi:MAG TPA: hypothetical protein EYH56_01315 [Nanoarchaeota archaeon]|nr:hypothetical protein [Nanoarchaeota archaeon]
MSKKIIGIFSGKGGVGKTTVASNLAVVLAKSGKKVTIVDCNLTASHLNFHFNFHLTPLTLNQVLKGEAEIEDVIYKFENLNIIPASLDPYETMGIDISKLSKVLKRHVKSQDYILLDTAPGFGKEALEIMEICDEAIIVSTPDIQAITDIIRGKRILEDSSVKVLGIVLNKVTGKKFEFTKKEVEALTDLPVLTEIPFSYKFLESLALRIPLVLYHEKSLPSLKFYKLASHITQEKIFPKLGISDKIKLLLSLKLKRI